MLVLRSEIVRHVSEMLMLTSVKLRNYNIAQDSLPHDCLGKYFSDAKSWTNEIFFAVFPLF